MEKKMKKINSYFHSFVVLASTPKGFFATLLASVLAYFSPISTIIGVIFLFVILDLVTGIWAAKKRKEKIRSHTMRNSVTKLLCYLITIILSFLLQKEIITFDWFAAVNISGALISLSEFKSIIENLQDITGSTVFKQIFKSISDIFKKKKDDITNLPNDEPNSTV